MSLEAILEKLNTNMERNNELLETIVKGKAGGGETSAPAKTGRGKAKAKAEDSGDDDSSSGDEDGDAVNKTKLAKTVDLVKGWLKEFSEDEDDPENDARSEKLAAALEKIGAPTVSKITTEDQRTRVEKWVKTRIEEGRITPDPKAKGKSKVEDDDI